MKTREACNVHKMLFSYIHACTQNANCTPWVPGKNGSLKLIVRHMSELLLSYSTCYIYSRTATIAFYFLRKHVNEQQSTAMFNF